MAFRIMVVAGVVLGLAVSSVSAQLPDFAFIFSEGSARTEVPPDTATVSFEIIAFEAESAKAFEVAEARTADLLELCQGLKIPEGDIVAYELEKEAQRDRSKNYQDLAILGYEFRREVHVTIHNLALYPEFVSALIAMENVTAPESSFQSSRRAEVEAQLIAEACENARTEAELMAEGCGVKLGAVFAISPIEIREVGAKFIARAWSRSGNSARGTVAPIVLFVPSVISVSKSVHVMYRIEDA